MRLTTESDDALASRTAIFEALRTRIHAIAQRIVGNRANAEDIVQDTFVRWVTSSADDVRVPAAWFTTVATRLAIDHVRRARREREKLDDASPAPGEEPAASSAEERIERASQVAHGVRLLFERLNPEERAALLLYEAFDADYASIAATLGRTPAHCRQMVHRAKRRLLADDARTAGRERAEDEAVAALVDAIARQDREAVIVSIRTQTAANARACAAWSAMSQTAALIVRLRRGQCGQREATAAVALD
jgi:RNA polymerase sigma-70 factor (ECF subfamily)